jgi:hypothetical protein
MNAITARNEILKWVGAFVACIVIGIVIYLGAVLHMYILGWVVGLFGWIFG